MPSHSDIINDPKRLYETRDCAVVATANVLNVSYTEAHALLKSYGRRDRRGTRLSTTKTALESRATVVMKPIREPILQNMTFFARRPRPTVAQFLRTLPKAGRFWLASTTHAFAYVDGELRDNIDGGKMRARMTHCYEITLPTPVRPEIPQSDINAMWERLNRLEAKL